MRADPERSRRFRRDSLLTLLSTVAVGLGNYGFSLALIWVLPTRSFAVTASVSTLILVAATAANSALPWVLAREVARHPAGEAARREAVGFVLGASGVGGVIAAGVVVALASPYASVGVEAAAAWGVLAIFVIQVSGGFLQGSGRFGTLAVLGVVEVVVKVGFGIGLAAAGGGSTGAIVGAALGATVWAVAGFGVVGREVAVPRRATGKELWTVTRGIGSIQVGVVVLTTLDVVVGSIVQHGSNAIGGYQAMLVFARVPFFVAGAVSAVAYPRLVAAGADRRPVVQETMGFYLSMSAAVVAVVATIPARLLGSVLPSAYSSDARLLLPLALAGLSAGQINLLTTFFQAENRFLQVVKLLWPAVPVAILVFALAGGSVESLAWAAAAIDSAVALMLTFAAERRFARAGILYQTIAWLLGASAFAAVLYAARSMLPLWLVLGAVGGLGIQLGVQRRRVAGVSAPSSGAQSPPSEIPFPVTAAPRRARAGTYRRRLLAATTWFLSRVRPLAPPAAWRLLLSARSAVGAGPVVCVPAVRRALLLAPHPDDETIGCGGTVALLTSHGADVAVVVASSGGFSTADPGVAAPDVIARRKDEAAAACRVLGTRPPVFLDLPDSELSGDVEALAAMLTSHVAETCPEVIFVPWVLDAHPDHEALATALSRVSLPPGCEVWAYEVWSPLPANRLVDITSVWKTKVSALECHQSGRGTFDLDAHLALSRWRSIFVLQGSGHAEAFLALRADQFRALATTAPT